MSRRNAIYTHPLPDFSESGLICEGYIYQVKLPAKIQKHDLAWITPLQKAQLKIKYNLLGMMEYPDWSEELLKECADSYWNGIASTRPNWEYLAPYMIIAKRLSDKLIEPKDTKGGWKFEKGPE